MDLRADAPRFSRHGGKSFRKNGAGGVSGFSGGRGRASRPPIGRERETGDATLHERGDTVARHAGDAIVARLFSGRVAAYGAAAGQSSLATQGGLPRVTTILAAISRRSATGMEERGGNFEAGARNVATLYEYWLFFQLEELFRQRFKCDQPLHAVVVDKSKAPPQLVLKRGVELKTPVSGVWSQTAGRDLRAEFHFNRKFTPRSVRDKAGSWTRGVQPDYTISIWPARYSKEEAEQNELMVHVHFDAKYRVERVSELLGDSTDDDAFNKETEQKEEARTAAKYADLLKMHAYRDAVRRTAGAYVLYPGKPGDGQKFVGFHEVLPGLGAFAIRPDKNGKAEGLNALADFLDRVIEHLANRTTARERVSYHVSESYTPQELKEQPVPYGSLVLPESDVFGEAYRALPPAEHQVVVAWYDSPKQLEWIKTKGIANVRLGKRKGTWHVPPEISSARHLLLRTHKGVVAPGLWRLKKAGYKVFTDTDLLKTEYPETTGGEIYAVFEVEEDPAWRFQDWNGAKIMDVIEAYESSVRYRLVPNLGRTSPYPRVLPLRELLKARL